MKINKKDKVNNVLTKWGKIVVLTPVLPYKVGQRGGNFTVNSSLRSVVEVSPEIVNPCFVDTPFKKLTSDVFFHSRTITFARKVGQNTVFYNKHFSYK